MNKSQVENGTIVKRTRASGPKHRTGCKTCKKRHVKCDERKPECIRCASTGRKCEGYENDTASKTTPNDTTTSSDHTQAITRHTPTSPAFQLSPFSAQSPKELRSIELFFHKAAPQLSGYFQRPFWDFVLQVSFEEASIRHALVAVSAVYEEDCIVWGSNTAGAETLKKLSLDYYNRSIRSMVRKMQERKDSIVVPVIGCLLFVCLEFLRKDTWAAIKHIDGGIRMIEQMRERKTRARGLPHAKTKPDAAFPDFETQIVESLMTPIFCALNINAAVFGRPGVYLFSRHGEPTTESLPNRPMTCINDAVGTLLDLINANTKFIHDSGMRKASTGVLLPEDFTERDRLLDLLEQWKRGFDSIDFGAVDSWYAAGSRGKTMLTAAYTHTRIWLRTACSLYESAWDAFKDDYRALLDMVDQVLSDPVRFPNQHSKLFSFELGIIPALEVVARKCRYPTLRRRALALMARCPKRECLYDAFYSTLLDERLRQIEEESLQLAPGAVPLDDQLPPEHARIHIIFYAHEEVPGLRGWPVSFMSKPHGVERPWHARKELIDVQGRFRSWKEANSPFNEVVHSLVPQLGPRPYDCAEDEGAAAEADGRGTEAYAAVGAFARVDGEHGSPEGVYEHGESAYTHGAGAYDHGEASYSAYAADGDETVATGSTRTRAETMSSAGGSRGTAETRRSMSAESLQQQQQQTAGTGAGTRHSSSPQAVVTVGG